MGLLPASFKIRLLNQITCSLKIDNAACSVPAALAVMMDCCVKVQNTGARLRLTRIPVVDDIVLFHPAQTTSEKAANGEERIMLFGKKIISSSVAHISKTSARPRLRDTLLELDVTKSV